jgi:hypothetical protein
MRCDTGVGDTAVDDVTMADEHFIDHTGRRWPASHVRLLALIGHYAHAARSLDECESWIRHLPLNVLVYEAVALGMSVYPNNNTLYTCQSLRVDPSRLL